MFLKKGIHFFSYIGFRLIGFPISLLSYSSLHCIGRGLGTTLYYLHRPFRKKALTNLAIAKTLELSEKQRKQVAKQAFQTLAITCLEFFRLKRSKNKIGELVKWGEPKQATLDVLDSGKGIVFLTGHQANWEVTFLSMTELYPGTAIGRPIKNPWLYKWVLSVREMHGGNIVMPKKALSQGYKALKTGAFMGIVGDQALPESSYSYPLFGTRAWTTTAPALLAYRTGCPLIAVMNKREKNQYHLSGSPLLWPDLNKPIKEEVPRLMDAALGYLEESIKENPGQWLWQHDRWKQSGVDHVKRKYRFGFILITLPQDPAPYLSLLPIFRKLYPKSFITLYVPNTQKTLKLPKWAEIHFYEKKEDLFQRDWRYQILFDFCNDRSLRRHFLKLGVFKALNAKKLYKIASKELKNSPVDLKTALKSAICKPDCIPRVFKDA